MEVWSYTRLEVFLVKPEITASVDITYFLGCANIVSIETNKSKVINHILSCPTNSRTAKYVIVPVWYAINFSTGIQRVNDSSTTVTAKELFEDKT